MRQQQHNIQTQGKMIIQLCPNNNVERVSTFLMNPLNCCPNLMIDATINI